MYVVFGANGHTGSVVADTLIEHGNRVRAVARDPTKLEALRAKGAEVVAADVLDVASVANALRGAEGAYLLIPPDNASTDRKCPNECCRLVSGSVSSPRGTAHLGLQTDPSMKGSSSLAK